MLANLTSELAIAGLGSAFFWHRPALTAASVNLNNFQPHYLRSSLPPARGVTCEPLGRLRREPCVLGRCRAVIVAGGAAYLCYEYCASLSQSTTVPQSSTTTPQPAGGDVNGVPSNERKEQRNKVNGE